MFISQELIKETRSTQVGLLAYMTIFDLVGKVRVLDQNSHLSRSLDIFSHFEGIKIHIIAHILHPIRDRNTII